jgi:hypothetical protein
MSLKYGPLSIKLQVRLVLSVANEEMSSLPNNIFSLPGATAGSPRCHRQMTANLRSPGNERRWHGRREGKKFRRGAVSTDVILVGSELTAFGSDTLEVLLGRSIGVTNLEEKALFANGLTMKLSDDLLADITALKSEDKVSRDRLLTGLETSLPSKANTTAVVVGITQDSAGTNGIVHEDSTKFLPIVSYGKTGRCTRNYRFGHVLRKVRDVEVSRLLVTLRLETRVEGFLEFVSNVKSIEIRWRHTLAKPTSYPN